MTQHLIQDVKVAVVKEKTPEVKPPPPPPPDFKVPPPDYVPPPDITIATPVQTDAITQVQKKVAVQKPPPPVTPVVPPRAVGNSHNCDSYYPPLSRRLSEEGKVLIRYSIDTAGNIGNATVVKSSGYSRLDQAAVQCVDSRWRSHPATQGGKPLAMNAEAYVVFRLR
jgi:protein TonB